MNNPGILTSLTLLLFLLAGCAPGVDVTQVPTEDEMPVTPLRFLALGDSYTIGQSVAENERWPLQLARLLEDYGYAADVQIVARTGWTTDELKLGINDSEISPPYDLVSLLIGVNNQYRGYSQTEYRQQFRELLNDAIRYAGNDPSKVLVLSIPDWGATPFGQRDHRNTQQVAGEIDSFNAINREEAMAAGVRYIDVTPISRQASSDPSLVAQDGLHPSGKMYAAWAKLALPEVLDALGLK